MDAGAVGASQSGMNASLLEDRTTRVLVAVPIVVAIVMDALYVAIAVNQNSLDHARPEKFIRWSSPARWRRWRPCEPHRRTA